MSQGFYQPDLDIEYIEYTLPREEKYKNCYSETKHGYYQIIFALSGKYRVMSNEKIVELNPGEFAIASILFFNGMDSITISKRLGHAKVSTTTDIYSHIIKQADEAASDCIADVLFKGKGKKNIS